MSLAKLFGAVAFDVGVHIDDSFLSLDSTCRSHHWLKFVGSGVVHNCGDSCFSMRDAIATQTAVIVSGGVSIELGGCLSFDDLLSDAAKDDGQRADKKWLHGLLWVWWAALFGMSTLYT